MNVLYLLGNGFDKAQGLATSYQEFYTDYQTLESESEIETLLKKDIDSNYENWADLEEGLGKYSSRFADANGFRMILGILNTRLKEYLNKQVHGLESKDFSRAKLINDLMHPAGGLEPKQKADLDDYISKRLTSGIIINWVSFNYTNTFEIALGKSDKTIGFLSHNQHDVPVFFNNLLHIHGSLEDMILMGVNDANQIANESFRNNLDIREVFVKPEINNGCENLKNEIFCKLIDTAEIIVLFGVSVGLTDSFWWKKIGERFNDHIGSLRLVYYPYDTTKDIERYQYRKLRWSKEYIAFLKDRMGIKTSVDELRDFIYVGINKPFLKLR